MIFVVDVVAVLMFVGWVIIMSWFISDCGK